MSWAAHDPEITPRWLARVFWAGTGGAALIVLVLARALSPDPRGVGTHTQLGLPPCGFLYLTSLPCPACGLTTAFAHLARLEITSGVRAHPLGLPLFLCTVLALPLSSVAFVRAYPIEDAIARLRLGPLAAMMALSGLLSWIARVAGMLCS